MEALGGSAFRGPVQPWITLSSPRHIPRRCPDLKEAFGAYLNVRYCVYGPPKASCSRQAIRLRSGHSETRLPSCRALEELPS